MSGCGGAPHSTPPPAEQSSTAAPLSAGTTVSAPSRTSGNLVVSQQGNTPAKTLWYLRVEDMTAKPLLEQAFPNQRIALDRAFPVGRYRVMVWYRTCGGSCPTTGESGLGPLQQICGAQLDLTAGRQVKATALINPDVTCTVKVTA
jgi:hypothetical protein